MIRDTILCLCDLTGVMALPWVDAGYRAILIDPQHPEGVQTDGPWIRVGHIIDHPESWRVIRENLGRIAFVAGFPECTDVSLSGTRWWAKKAAADRYFQCKATRVAEQCQTIGNMSGAPWIMENPMSAFSRIFRQPDHKFHPFHYTGWEPDDNYRKETWLWCGGGFVMPPALEADGLEPPDNRIHHCPPGAERANIRSATPRGFARAVFAANGDIGRNRQSSHPLGPKVERWVQEIEQGEEA
ncbi:hypothetical protein [Kushneria konosiri]|uniref:hypothetical protein n=1 Tax=Kushneria konosiri TaxID=698828 RepID=UPI001D1314AF|nr:hypothetical protein [Kushneria konosiri]